MMGLLESQGFPSGSDGKESVCSAVDLGSIPGSGRSPGEGNGNPSPVFLPGEFHGERSLVGCSSWGCKESGTTEATERMHAHTQISHLPLHFLIFLIGSSN